MPLTTESLRPPEPPEPREYTVKIAAELAAEYADWKRVPNVEAKVETRADGTAEVLLRTVDP